MTDLFVEVFPIESESFPEQITAYHIVVDEAAFDHLDRIGSRLARRLARAYGGMWLWMQDRLLTDADRNPIELMITVDMLKSERPDIFGAVQNVEPDVMWQPSPQDIVDVTLKSTLAAEQDQMQAALTKLNTRIRNASIERSFRLQGWQVGEEPAVSISIASRMIYDQTLQQFAGKERDASALKEQLVGLRVIDINDKSIGEVTAVVGPIAQHRARLLEIAHHEEARRVLENALDGEWVVKVKLGRDEFEYLASALQVIVRIAQIDRFALDARQATQALQMTPADRAQHVRAVSDVAKSAGILGNGYNSRVTPDRFFQVDFEMNLRFDENRVRPYKPETLRHDFTSCGAYKLRDAYKNTPIRVCVINTLSFRIEDFVEAMQRLLDRSYNFSIDVVRERQVRVINRTNLESAIRVVEKENPDIILAFFPDDIDKDDDEESAAGDTAAYIRSLTLGRGIPTHIINETMLNNPDEMPAIIMGILGKTGNAPFVLAEPLEYTDFLAGLDVVQEKTDAGLKLTAIARIYKADGEFVQYRIRSFQQEGDALPYTLLRDLFPQKEFANKRIVLHHDGALPPNLLAALTAWGQAISATFYPMEIVRFGAPRIYAIENGIVQPPWGSAFKFSDMEALLVSSIPKDNITPQPLQIRTVGTNPLPIEQALRGVLVWTLLAYNAEKLPKLPVTVMNATELEYWLQRGGKFGADEGHVPFWL